MIKWIDFIKSEQDQIPPTPVSTQSYTVKSECWSGSLYLEVVFRWQPLHCTTSSQQSVHVFRSDQPGQEIKENTTFTFDIQHCLTCAHDYASLQQHIQAAQTFQRQRQMNSPSVDDQSVMWWPNIWVSDTQSSCHCRPAHLGLIMTNLALIYICYNNWQQGTVS